ncbi:hypothetical protein OG905_28155 [Streptomyces sp. NBC_00322]|uniref:hypothetical protein n=1 Tax=Streptomyces sp. NBC_00322 TaxID=2975712 RepID=UPI002E2A7DBA|nr:hypothetical protein [Streptomyces sp. NBC_00322]
MSWQPQHGNGAYGASGANGVYHAEQANLADGANGVYAGNGAYQDRGDTQGLPLVSHRYGDSPLAYDGYVDPAAGQGWQESAATGHGVAPGDAFGHPRGTYADGHDAYGGGHNTHEGGFGPHETDHGAYGIEHDHIYRDDGYAYRTDDDQDDAGHADGSVFVDASGRRSRLIRRAALAVAAVCVVFIAVVIAGFFSPVPSGGVLPWSEKQEGSTKATDQPGSTDRLTAGPSATPEESAAPSPSPSVSATKTGGETTELPTKAPTTTAASTTSAPGQGNSGDHPGGQGSTKGPR